MRSAVLVAAVHAMLGYAFIAGLRFDAAAKVGEALKLFDVVPEPPPPPLVEEVAPPEVKARDPEGAAAPPNLKSKASPVVAPPPQVRLEVPPPIVAAPVPGTGSEASAGASETEGPGTGAGGEGTGTGRGSEGDGAGGGGIATRARHRKGRIVGSDYPNKAGDAGAEGTVLAHFSVGVDGRASQCKVVQSSGNAELDSTTCRLIERRFRYEPARDAQGRAVPDVMGWEEVWWIGSRRRPPVSGPAEAGDHN